MTKKNNAASSQEALLLKVAASLDNLADALEQEEAREQELLQKRASAVAREFDYGTVGNSHASNAFDPLTSFILK